jgi:hypothetical protein
LRAAASAPSVKVSLFENPQGALGAFVEGYQMPFGDVSYGITEESAARLAGILLSELGIERFFDSL